MQTLDLPVVSSEPLASVLNILRLGIIGPGSFVGSNSRQFPLRVYGGQILAQAVVAAYATFANEYKGRQIHSLTSAFVRPGDVGTPTYFSVDDILDGNSFSTRSVKASQNGKTIFSARASFQEVQSGPEHCRAMPETVDPGQLESSAAFFSSLNTAPAQNMAMFNPVDLRHVDGPIWLRPQKHPQTRTQIWFRLRSPLPQQSSQLLHRAMLVYAADQFMLEPILRAHGLFWFNPRLSPATLNHSTWWHRDVNMSDWILADLSTPSAQGGRGLSIAEFFQNGTHIATMAQEGMVRVKDGPRQGASDTHHAGENRK